jgi:hypothetical protein
MVIIGTMPFPPQSAKEVGKCFMEISSVPDYITMRGPYTHGVKGEGIQSTTLYEFDRSTMAEAFEHVGNRYVAYHGVTGLTYAINVCLEAQEALKMIGLA